MLPLILKGIAGILIYKSGKAVYDQQEENKALEAEVKNKEISLQKTSSENNSILSQIQNLREIYEKAAKENHKWQKEALQANESQKAAHLKARELEAKLSTLQAKELVQQKKKAKEGKRNQYLSIRFEYPVAEFLKEEAKKNKVSASDYLNEIIEGGIRFLEDNEVEIDKMILKRESQKKSAYGKKQVGVYMEEKTYKQLESFRSLYNLRSRTELSKIFVFEKLNRLKNGENRKITEVT